MWDRKELKEKGRNVFRANRITCILAGFLLSLTTGSASFSPSAVNRQTYDAFNIPPEAVRIIIAVIGTITVAGFLLTIFLLNPLQVGLKKFFLDNSFDQTTGLTKSNIGVAFSDGNYTNVVAAMFTTGFFAFLWSLLFIIPGIIKAYAWRMVPYILAKDPEMTGTEARKISEKMMNGSKWASFVLDLSFFGWLMLGVITLGIGNIVWTTPYHAATDAELYRTLNGEAANVFRGAGGTTDDDTVEFEVNDEVSD